MRYVITTSVLLFFLSPLFGQKDSTFFINEYTVSVNLTEVKDSNTENKVGFGFGIYRSCWDKSKVNLVVGLEFNMTNQLKLKAWDRHFGLINVTYRINSMSIPVVARVNFGKKTKVFVEAGAFLDINGDARRNGTGLSFNATDSSFYQYDFTEKYEISKLNYGPSVGLGLKIRVSKYAIIIKADYKYGVMDLSENEDDVFNRYFRFIIGFKL